jgi:DNA-binding HxlR family transcriptional regulator
MTRHNDDRAEILEVTFSTPTPEYDIDKKEVLFKQLGQAHMIPILHEFESTPGPRRFSELQEQLDVPETTLTERLRELTESGFITRESFDEIPPRVEYTATQKTKDLTPAFEYLSRWGIHYDH